MGTGTMLLHLHSARMPARFGGRQPNNLHPFCALQTELPEQPKMIDDGKAKSITRTSGASLQLGKQHFDLVFTYRFVFRERLKYSYDPSLSAPDVFIETVTCNGREIGSGGPTNIPTIVFQEKLDGLFDVCSLEWQLYAPRRQATAR